MKPQTLKIMKSEIAKSVKETVNGKIDTIRTELRDHNAQHEKDMLRIMPIIENFEETQNDLRVAKKAGRVVLWVAATITAIGGAVLIILRIKNGL